MVDAGSLEGEGAGSAGDNGGGVEAGNGGVVVLGWATLHTTLAPR
jgi:hypothetical protein